MDSRAQAFCIPEDKKIKFPQLREQILLRGSTITLKSLQGLMGKCNSFSLAFPATKFYIREMAAWRHQSRRVPEVVRRNYP